MAEDEADGGSADRHTITCAYDADALRSIQQAGGRRRVVIGRTWAGFGQYPAVEDARCEYRDATPLAGREQAVRSGGVKQRVAAPTLRGWEDRYGFPRPHRLAGGHRRYDHGDVALIEAVVRLRASGISLQAAISQAASRAAEAEPSVFAGLRRRHPALTPQVLRKVTLLALTRAIEDECCARAERPVLFAGFQRQRFFRQSEERWNELARTARVVVVFADFSGPAEAGGRPPGEPAPIRVPLPQDAPARREWTLVCESRDYPACVTGWEFPGQREAADPGRRFEVIWSVDPQVVSNAAAICAQLARSARPGLGRLLDALPSEPAPPASADLRRAAGLLSRMTGYLEKAAERQAR